MYNGGTLFPCVHAIYWMHNNLLYTGRSRTWRTTEMPEISKVVLISLWIAMEIVFSFCLLWTCSDSSLLLQKVWLQVSPNSCFSWRSILFFYTLEGAWDLTLWDDLTTNPPHVNIVSKAGLRATERGAAHGASQRGFANLASPTRSTNSKSAGSNSPTSTNSDTRRKSAATSALIKRFSHKRLSRDDICKYPTWS